MYKRQVCDELHASEEEGDSFLVEAADDVEAAGKLGLVGEQWCCFRDESVDVVGHFVVDAGD